MNRKSIALLAVSAALAILLPACVHGPLTQANAASSSAAQISRDSRAALASLYAQDASARALGRKAKGVLVFPSVVRGGLLLGGQAGNGAMIRDTGEISGFYQTVAGSYGLQGGMQTFGYALFFMDDDAYANLRSTGGWELGSSPSIVIVEKGMAGGLTNATLHRGTYAYFFNQRGLMAGLGLQGSKITRIHPRK